VPAPRSNSAYFRSWRSRGVLLLVVSVLGMAGGCLSLGGKTTFVSDSPETEAKIAALEARIAALEQALAGGQPVAPPPALNSGEFLPLR
jgi:hypothetical protein